MAAALWTTLDADSSSSYDRTASNTACSELLGDSTACQSLLCAILLSAAAAAGGNDGSAGGCGGDSVIDIA